MKECPFPQANNMELIYNIFFDIGPEGISKFDVARKYGLENRQGAYYLDALVFIGLSEKVNIKYFLTSKGVEIRLRPLDEVRIWFCKAILNNSFLGTTYENSRKFLDKNTRKEYIASCISNSYGLNITTSKRRAGTIVSWFDWIIQQEGSDE